MLSKSQIAELTAAIASGYVQKNSISPSVLPELIANVSDALSNLGNGAATPAADQVPPVNPKRSIQPDYIISLEDGKKYKSLKRHLGVRGLTPEEYRAKWNLPATYPMVAPNWPAAGFSDTRLS